MQKNYRTFRYIIPAIICFLVIAVDSGASDGLRGKLIVGYQGWFGCPGDLPDNRAWPHWFFKNNPSPENLAVDLLPDLSRLDPKDLCETGLSGKNGSPVRLYSAGNAHVVATHFKWMADYGIDGAAVQRFVGLLSGLSNKRRCDLVLSNARAGAEAAGRVFFVTYDVSGADPRTVINDIRDDWRYLVNDLKITSSSSYLRMNGKPVLQIWGFGFTDRPGSPSEVAELTSDLRKGAQGLEPVTLLGGVPAFWRTLTGDSKTDPAWAPVYRGYDVISPWLVGRFSNDAGIDNLVNRVISPDLEETRRLGIEYMPVIFPGFSWFNLQNGRGVKKRAVLNEIPRRCGKFLWHQVSSYLNAHVQMLYAAMFDEMDEGTALFPTVTEEENLPNGSRMVFLNQDGCSLSSDWYLRITGRAADYLHNGEAPPASLDQALVKFTDEGKSRE